MNFYLDDIVELSVVVNRFLLARVDISEIRKFRERCSCGQE